MNRSKRENARPPGPAWGWPAAILLAAILASGLMAVRGQGLTGTLSNPFLHDDLTVIGMNPAVQAKGRALEAFTTDYWAMRRGDRRRDRLYRPLVTLSLALNRSAGGNAPAGYRAVNIALHAIASLLLFWLALRFGLGSSAAGAVGILFALHPVHTEPVNAVVGRADLLAAIGVFGGMGLLVGGALPGLAASGKKKIEGGKTDGLSCPVGAGLLFALALLSKEIGVALLLWAGLWWLWCRGPREETFEGRTGALLKAAAALGAVLGAYLLLRYVALGMWVRPVPPTALDNPLAHAALGGRMLGALGVLGRYFGLIIWPWPLSIDYSYAQVMPAGAETALWALQGVALLLLWTGAAWRYRADSPGLAFGLTLFLAAYLPVSNLLIPIGTVMAERLLYLPLAGFLIAVIPQAGSFLSRRAGRAPAVLLTLAGILFAGLSFARNGEWSTPLRFWESAAKSSPRSARALRLYGQSLYAAGSFREAIPPLERATRIYPRYDPAWVDLGIAQMQSRREKEAEVSLRRALKLNPDSPEGQLSLGVLMVGTGRPEKGRPHLEKAIALNPNLVEARFNLGTLYMKAGESAKAIRHFQAALSVDPRRAEVHHNLAIAHMVEGDRARARRHAREAERLGMRLRPGLAKALGLEPRP